MILIYKLKKWKLEENEMDKKFISMNIYAIISFKMDISNM